MNKEILKIEHLKWDSLNLIYDYAVRPENRLYGSYEIDDQMGQYQ